MSLELPLIKFKKKKRIVIQGDSLLEAFLSAFTEISFQEQSKHEFDQASRFAGDRCVYIDKPTLRRRIERQTKNKTWIIGFYQGPNSVQNNYHYTILFNGTPNHISSDLTPEKMDARLRKETFDLNKRGYHIEYAGEHLFQ